MEVRSLAELREADEPTLMFGPLGIGGRMRAEDSAEFLQRVIARHELAPGVADGTRRSFDQLRRIFPYGLFCYAIFTLVAEHALLVFEQALKDRFIEFHQGTVVFVDPRTGQEQPVAATSYEPVQEFAKDHRRLELRIGSGPETIKFNGMLEGLRRWARLWGPGSAQEMSACLDAGWPEDDEMDILDRFFLLRYHDTILYLPRNPDQAASVTEDEKPGTWYVLKADFPEHAFNHQRQLLAGGFGCGASEECPRCPVSTVGAGSWQEAIALVTANGVTPRKIGVPDVRVPPSLTHWPRCNRIIGNGSWDIPADEQVPLAGG